MPPEVFVLLNKYGEIYAPPVPGSRNKELRQAYADGLSALREQAEREATRSSSITRSANTPPISLPARKRLKPLAAFR